VLAFLLTSLAGAVLAAVFVRQFVGAQFDTYVVGQQRALLVADVRDYYTLNGSLAGIDQWLRERAGNRQPPQPGGPPGGREGQPIRFGLADPQGTLLTPFKGMQPGQRLPAADLAAGTQVSDGVHPIAVVLTPSGDSFRDPAQNRYLARTDSALAIAAAGAAGIALLLGSLLARLITRPLRELTAAAGRIAAGNLEQRVEVRSRDELGQLASQFNQMSADLAHANQLRRQMTADIAHDLRTPLTVISGYLESLRDQVLKPTPERFATLYDETQLLQRLVDDLHTLSLADAGELTLQRRAIAPAQIIERTAEVYRHAAEQAGVALEVRAAADLPLVAVDQERMSRALGNLVSNALRYTPAGGTISLSARPAPSAVQIVVADSGSGIPAEHLPNIFERFYRADASRQQSTGGSGLGLAIVRSMVEAHGGTIGVTSQLGCGTTFTVTLPVGA
jgi:signal transduction histidine kinase